MSVKKLKKILEPILIAGKEVLPIFEGGKGISVSSGLTAGSFAKENAVGTFSAVMPELIDENGEVHLFKATALTRRERHEELVSFSIKAAISQARRAFDISGKMGKIHMNVLWEMGGAKRVLEGVLEKAKGVISGVTCGAGMPYQLADIAKKYQTYYFPIVSSARALRALWKRSYHKASNLLGGVVYECPWRAGGHNGLSNSENPLEPQSPYNRLVEIRSFLNEVGMSDVPIILAGGVWNASEYEDYLDNKDIGKIAFQFGTRPLFTKESPLSNEWKQKLFSLKEGDVFLNKFSPTGFYSSAVNNNFLQELQERSSRQVAFKEVPEGDFNQEFVFNARGRKVFLKQEDAQKVLEFKSLGFSEALKTPAETMIFVSKEKKEEIAKDQIDCTGCLSGCLFSNWAEHMEGNTTGFSPDSRSFCISKTLFNGIHTSDIENNLMFAGSNVFRFAQDKWYKGGKFMPSVKELVERIQLGM